MTRILNDSGRLKLILPEGILDVANASNGRFSHDPQAIFEDWDDFQEWAQSGSKSADATAPESARILSPVPRPRQIVGVGLNYHTHIHHSGLKTPTEPGVFAKFLTSLAGPHADILLPSETVFTEAEAAVVIKREAYFINEDQALDHVAGVTVAQDLYDRTAIVNIPKLDGSGGATYLNPSKSLATFTPLGPEVVSLEAAGDLGSLAIELDFNDTAIQRGNTSDLVFAIPELIARLSRRLRLLPGDVILTGSPARIEGTEGIALRPGDLIRASVAGLGTQLQVARPAETARLAS
ncbi:fumarylacetoacetate hydrolase family protein [Shinella sp. CPCC 101442]|uniref:fumarylacetoacetate hydrolase family protein n=1 Tax=Shinella sp. CPCC 101442 TaxID=2932265 RepID=UPI0021527D23|nr:fumarylacetoacetate hydrolase family protein [Shinella sp. CPCC 101442]MCR6502369.1 fumarylacetoacetate hydrolase family protein [Shinella sp. CPCC 101442]